MFFCDFLNTFARNRGLGDELSLTALVGKSLLKRLMRIFPFERISKNEMSVLSSRKMSVWRTSPSHFLAFCSSSWTTSLTWSSDKKSLIFVILCCVCRVLYYIWLLCVFCFFGCQNHSPSFFLSFFFLFVLLVFLVFLFCFFFSLNFYVFFHQFNIFPFHFSWKKEHAIFSLPFPPFFFSPLLLFLSLKFSFFVPSI